MRMFRATADDVPRMIECAKLCCLEHGEAVLGGKLDAKHYEQTWCKLIESGIGVMFLVEDETGKIVGGIGGARYPTLLTGLERCTQLFVYVRPEYRGRISIRKLMRELEIWAVEIRAHDICMPLLKSMPGSTRDVYEKMGYTETETQFRKTLEPVAT